jgi:hypothetical protein
MSSHVTTSRVAAANLIHVSSASCSIEGTCESAVVDSYNSIVRSE